MELAEVYNGETSTELVSSAAIHMELEYYYSILPNIHRYLL